MRHQQIIPGRCISEENDLLAKIEIMKAVEDLVFEATEEAISSAIIIIRDNPAVFSNNGLINLIFSVSKVRPFAYKILAHLYKNVCPLPTKQIHKEPFASYLYSLGYFSESEFYIIPKRKKVPEYFECIFLKGSLSYAIMNDDHEMVSFLSSTIDLENHRSSIFKKMISPLNLAAFCGSIKVFKYLLINNYPDDSSTSQWSIKGGNINVIQLVEQRGLQLENYISIAIKYHHHNIFHWLINIARDNDALLPKCVKWCNTTVFQHYISKGKNIEELDKGAPRSSLFYAVLNANILMVKFLVTNGANIDAKNDFFK